MPKGGSCAFRQNVFLFKPTATYTRFWVICSKMQCVLVLNAVQYAAKRSAFWCKMQRVLVQNAACFGAKCSAFWCKMQGEMVLNAVRFSAKRKVKCGYSHKEMVLELTNRKLRVRSDSNSSL